MRLREFLHEFKINWKLTVSKIGMVEILSVGSTAFEHLQVFRSRMFVVLILFNDVNMRLDSVFHIQ